MQSRPQAFHTLEEIKAKGFNATLLSGESLRHAVDYYPEEHHFLSLHHLEERDTRESVFVLFIVEEEQLEELKDVIRKETGNFHDIKGFMYSRPIEDYEGTF